MIWNVRTIKHDSRGACPSHNLTFWHRILPIGFRYCTQVLDEDIDASCTALLQDLVRFQDRLYHKDPIKVSCMHSQGWLTHWPVGHLNAILYIEGILPKGPYLPCVSMAGRALLAGYPRYIIFNLILVIDGGGISCEIVLWKMSSDLTDDKSTLV